MNLINILYETAVDLYTETTYRYREGRNTVPNRLNFDTQKLIDCGAIVICKGMNGNPESPDYKKHLDDGSTNLITLYNIKHTIKNNPDSWILEAIKHPITIAPIGWKDMSLETYDGKYNQILWSLKKLGIPFEDVLKHNSLNESEEESRKTAHLKRVENVYKFLKKGTFKFKATNNVDGDFYKIYSYELSDKHRITTEEIKGIGYRSVIYCEATVLDTNREDILKLRPKMINNKINYFFQKYKVDEIILERVDGDVERESVAYPGD